MTVQSTAYISEIRELLPPEWTTASDDTWFYGSHPATPMAIQGWKLHISSRLGPPAIATLQATVKICIKYRVNFKTTRTPSIHERLNSKQARRQESNKFITLYPNPEVPELLSQLVRDLVLTADDAPIVLSDLQIGKQLHARYGAHRGVSVLQPDGAFDILISDPRDGTLIPDPRGPFFSPPTWITTHPITGKPLDDDDDSDSDIYELNEYTVIDALHFSATGGVYRGRKTATGEAVVLKEGIRNAMYLHDQDAVDRIEAEYRMLEHLAATGVTPKPFSLFAYEEHKFMVMEYIDAPTLSETAPLAFGDALAIAKLLAEAIGKIHTAGVVLGDLSARNVLLPKSGGVKIIDLEGAYFTRSAPPPEIVFATPGYAAAARVKGTADDIYSLGAVLTHLFLGRINLLYDLAADPTAVAKRFFRAAGMPPALITLITECLAADAEARPSASAVGYHLSRLQGRLLRLQGAPTEVSSVDTEARVDMDIDRTINALVESLAADAQAGQERNKNEGRRLGIAEGIAGQTLTLQYLTADAESDGAPTTLVDPLNAGRLRLLAADLDIAKLPPGLANGLAGIAYAIHRTTDAVGYAETLMSRALAHPMLENQNPNFPVTLMHGVTGIGLTALYFYKQSGDPAFLDGAVWCAQRLKDAVASEPVASKAVFYFAVADALGETVDAKRWCLRGRDCLNALAKAPSSQTKRGMNAHLLEVAVRQAKRAFGDDADESWSTFAMPAWDFSKDFIADPSLGSGLSGLGLAYLDHYHYGETGEAIHLGTALKIAKTVACFTCRSRNGKGIVFPGADLRGADFGLFGGTAGALVFLERLRQQPLPPAPFFPWEWL